LFLFDGLDDINKIAKTNEIKKEAKKAFENGDYELARDKYLTLLDSFSIRNDEIKLNLANCFYHLNDTPQALNNYKNVVAGDNKNLKSLAYQQLGVIAGKNKLLEQALNFFKQALINDPGNDEARYNYELIKKKLEEQKNQEQDQQEQKDQNKEDQKKDEQEKKDQDKNQEQDQKDKNQEQDSDQQQKNKDQSKQDNSKEPEDQKQDQKQNTEQEQQKQDQSEQNKQQKEASQDDTGEQNQKQLSQQSLEEKLKEMNLNPEKARMILEAMKNSEIQYIQQNKRQATKKPDSNKPDW
jgi:DNA polymerase III gamma/tau subunit